MKRRIAPRLDAESNPTLDLSSLVDVAFLLLIYFLVTSSLSPKEADLGFSMGPPPGPVTAPREIVVIDPSRIEIKADGSVFLDQEMIEPGQPDSRKLPNLVNRLKEIRYLHETLDRSRSGAGNQGARIFLAANDSSKGQRFMDVMDSFTEAGISSVSLSGFVE